MKCHSCPRFRKHKTRQYDGICCKFWASVRNDDVCREEKRAEMGIETIKRNEIL